MRRRPPLAPSEARRLGAFPRVAPPPPRRGGDEGPASSDSPYAERLHKILAHAGVASRRASEMLIREGRVKVDGKVVREMGLRVDPRRQVILFDDEPVRFERKAAYAIYKPKGVLCTNADELGRMRVIDLMKVVSLRIYPVGRLDKDSEGLLIVTNDGTLALRLTHPRYGTEKVYEVWVKGLLQEETVKKLRKGVFLPGEGKVALEEFKVLARHPESTRLRVILKEGRNREIRRVLARVGHEVTRLVRVAIGPVRLEDLPVGRYRELTRDEIAGLMGREPTQKLRAI